MTATAKFMFDVDFGSAPKAVQPTISATQHEAEVAEAEMRGYRNGMSAAEAQARTEAERRLAGAFEHIASGLDQLRGSLKTVEDRFEAEAVEVALAVSRQLAPGLIAREPIAEIERLVSGILAQVRSAPHVVVRLASNLVQSASGRLMKLAETRGYAGRLVLLPEPGLTADDCRIEWADGGVTRERAAIEARINEAVARYLGSRTKSSNIFDPESAT
jgi:flagellar assembly protein FliH